MKSRKADAEIPKPNPFTPSSGVAPKAFVNREEQVAAFQEVLDNAVDYGRCEHFLVVGPWGSGKTVLLNEFKSIAQKRGVQAVVASAAKMSKGDREADAVKYFVQDLTKGLPVEVGKLRMFYELMEQMGVDVLGFGVNFTKKSKEISSTSLFDETFRRLWMDFEDSADALLIMIDDVQNWDAVSSIFTNLKNVLSNERIVKGTRLVVGLSCTPEEWSQFMLRDHPIGRYFVPRMNLGNFTREDTFSLIDTLIEDTSINFNKNVKMKVYDYTRGHLYETHLLCKMLYKNQFQGRVTDKVWEASLNQTLSALGELVFGSFYDRASDMEKQLLYHLCTKNDVVEFTDFLTELNEKGVGLDKGNAIKHLTRLVDKNLVEKPGRGKYFISDKLFREYVLKISKTER